METRAHSAPRFARAWCFFISVCDRVVAQLALAMTAEWTLQRNQCVTIIRQPIGNA
jgi:hypothetical protein